MGKGELWHPADQKPLNRSSRNLIHVITSWVPITTQNLDAICPGVSSPHIREIYTLGCSHVYYTFFVGSSNRLASKRQRGHSRLIRQMTWFRARKCLLGLEKQILRFEYIFNEKSKNSYSRNGKILNCENSGSV